VAQSYGLVAVELSEAQRKELSVKGGVKVESATEGAARAGLREGDVILAVGNIEVTNLKEFDAALAKADKSKPLNVLFRRGEWTQYAVIRPSK
jgi:serine protease Do